MATRPLILLSNDDGVHAEGVRALRAALLTIGDVFVVAPEHEQSATSHRITLSAPLRHRDLGQRHPRGRRHAGRLRLRRAQPEGAAAAPPRPRGERHQPRLQPRHGRRLLGHRGRGARGCAARHPRAGDLGGSRRRHDAAWPAHCAPAGGTRALASSARSGSRLAAERELSRRASRAACSPHASARRDYEDSVEARTDPRGRSYYWIGGAGERSRQRGRRRHHRRRQRLRVRHAALARADATRPLPGHRAARGAARFGRGQRRDHDQARMRATPRRSSATSPTSPSPASCFATSRRVLAIAARPSPTPSS